MRTLVVDASTARTHGKLHPLLTAAQVVRVVQGADLVRGPARVKAGACSVTEGERGVLMRGKATSRRLATSGPGQR